MSTKNADGELTHVLTETMLLKYWHGVWNLVKLCPYSKEHTYMSLDEKEVKELFSLEYKDNSIKPCKPTPPQPRNETAHLPDQS